MKRVKLTIEEWNGLKNEEGIVDIPVWFKVTGKCKRILDKAVKKTDRNI